MAGTITITAQLSVVSGSSTPATESLGVSQITASMAGNRISKGVMQVPNSTTAIPLPGGTNGWCIFKNLDASILISLQVGSGGTKFADIPAGMSAGPFFVDAATTLYAIAASGTPDLEYMILEA